VPDFALDPRLADDTVPVTDLALCRVLLARDASYPWLIMVPRRAGMVEIVDLGEADRIALMQEIAAVSEALRATVPCDKLNVAALGNSVPQLHVHVIARQHDDAAWPGPIWGVASPKTYSPGAAETLAEKLTERLTPRR
jgi:diadenosine tetraphosphate (Ap4A) HIT family hydrolase